MYIVPHETSLISLEDDTNDQTELRRLIKKHKQKSKYKKKKPIISPASSINSKTDKRMCSCDTKYLRE